MAWRGEMFPFQASYDCSTAYFRRKGKSTTHHIERMTKTAPGSRRKADGRPCAATLFQAPKPLELVSASAAVFCPAFQLKFGFICLVMARPYIFSTTHGSSSQNAFGLVGLEFPACLFWRLLRYFGSPNTLWPGIICPPSFTMLSGTTVLNYRSHLPIGPGKVLTTGLSKSSL